MERLTRRSANGTGIYATPSGEPVKWENNRHNVLQKLADYEDAEDQGLLLRLPCKVGDILYCITPYAKEPIITTHVLQINIKQFFNGKIIVRIDVMDKIGESCYFLDDIGKKVFLSREEAEAKLKELRAAEFIKSGKSYQR